MAEDNQVGTAAQFPYSVKLESTAKGYRCHVHVYAATLDEARDQSIKLLTGTLIEMEAKRLPLAPSEGRA